MTFSVACPNELFIRIKYVHNQGNVDLYNIVVNDFFLCGYTYLPSNDAVWTYDGTGIATTSIPGVVAAGSSTTVSITLELKECVAADAWKNVSEIESFEDEDVDSDGDDDPSNDGDMSDNDYNNENGDEDDSDFEEPEIFDLAQDKTLVTARPYGYGDVLEYSICVENLGNMTAQNIVVTDYLLVGLSFDAALNPDWDGTVATAPTHTFAGPVVPLETVCATIFVAVEETTDGSDNYTNTTEITDSEDEDGDEREDAVSEEDDDPTNDS